MKIYYAFVTALLCLSLQSCNHGCKDCPDSDSLELIPIDKGKASSYIANYLKYNTDSVSARFLRKPDLLIHRIFALILE